jgi:IclR family acetate operon transcriptional repressor
MAVRPQRTTPTYAVNSVDKALRLLQMLRDVGEIRVKEASQELGISPSTVHRLMSMLVFRGFAQQDDSHVYLAGPAMGVPAVRLPGTKDLHAIAKPHLIELREATGETAYGMILAGRLVRCILTVESPHPSSAGDRHGLILPAEVSAAGQAMLAGLSPAEVDALCGPDSEAPLPRDEYDRLRARLDNVRSLGFALLEVESGLLSVAVPLRRSDAHPPMAVSISAPSRRAEHARSETAIGHLIAARDAIDRDLAAVQRGSVRASP